VILIRRSQSWLKWKDGRRLASVLVGAAARSTFTTSIVHRFLVPALMQPRRCSSPFHHDGWVYEEKVDGYRMAVTRMLMAYASRNSRDHSRRFPELVKALGGLKPKSFILDGEVAVFDKASSHVLNGFAPSQRTSPQRCPSTSPLTFLS